MGEEIEATQQMGYFERYQTEKIQLTSKGIEEYN
jgi:hypothetical protein